MVVELMQYDQGIVVDGVDVCVELMQQYVVVVGVVGVDVLVGYFQCRYVFGWYVFVYVFVVVIVVVVLEYVDVVMLQDVEYVFFGCCVDVVVLLVGYL